MAGIRKHMRSHWRPLCIALMFQVSCTYTPVYDSHPPVSPSTQASEAGESQTTATEQTPPDTRRVAIASPESVAQRNTSQPASGAATRLREEADKAIDAGNTAKAERLLDRALRIAPRDPQTYLQLGRLKLDSGDYNQALQLARKGYSLSEAGSHLANQL